MIGVKKVIRVEKKLPKRVPSSLLVIHSFHKRKFLLVGPKNKKMIIGSKPCARLLNK